jgi:hypothetical protein
VADVPAAEVGVAEVDGHAYVAPMFAPWGCCTTCGLAEAAHTASATPYTPGLVRGDFTPEARPYRCPFCVDRGNGHCRHRGQPLGMDGAPL